MTSRQQRRAAGQRGPLFTREQRKEGQGDPPQPRPTIRGLSLRAWNQWKALAHTTPMQCPIAFVENVMGWGTERMRSVSLRGIARRTAGICQYCMRLSLGARVEGSTACEFQRAELAMKREREQRTPIRLRRDGRQFSA